jgi:hypothetical protein
MSMSEKEELLEALRQLPTRDLLKMAAAGPLSQPPSVLARF